MITRRYPILLWSDPAGRVAAALAGTDGDAAVADTEEAALRQLRELLEWKFVNEPWFDSPELDEPRFIEVRVEVHPRYRSDKRIVPCPEPVSFLAPCIWGRQESGLTVCVIPHLAIQFQFQESADLKALVAHYVREALQGLNPAELASRLPPARCRLGELAVRDTSARTRKPAPEDRPELKSLFAVADPLLRGRAKGSAAYGRDDLVARLEDLLASGSTHLLLVGEPGVGKSTILREAARRVARRLRTGPDSDESADRPDDLGQYRFWRGNAARIVAGMRYLGEWEERCEQFIRDLSNIDGVFCAENLLELTSVGGAGPGDSVAAFLVPYLQKGELRLVAEATPAELDACRRLLPALADVFQIVPIPAFSEPDAESVLTRIGEIHAATAGLELGRGTVTRVAQLFRRFQPYATPPGPAAAFLRRLCEARPAAGAKPPRTVLPEHAVAAFARDTGLPELFLKDDLPLDPAAARDWFAQRVIGQPAAVETAVRLVTAIKAGLNDPERPLGVLLFCGPTGVGKTALARCLVDFCFGAGKQTDRLVRLDMSEYSGWGSARRFVSGPSGRPAPWIERVRQQPFCVVLLDEIEKAAPEVFDVLLGLLDEGRLTDRLGRITWFRSAIVVMTSNLGADSGRTLGFSADATPDYAGAVTRFFRPEFFNRLDEVVAFQPLDPAQIEAIARKELAELASREGLAVPGLRLVWSDALVRDLARTGYDHRLGARPLQRTIERRVATPVARWRVAHPRPRPGILRLECDDSGAVSITYTEDRP